MQVEELVFGTTEPAAIDHLLDRWCAEHLGAPIVATRFRHTSVGHTRLVELADGRRVAVKALPPRWTPAFLAATRVAQRHLADLGFPAPRPLAGPAPCGRGTALADEAVDVGPAGAEPGAAEQRASAATLARLVDLLRDRAGEPALAALSPHPLDPPPDDLYPEPHSPLFDFAATAADAGWIDALARAAAAARAEALSGSPAGTPVVAHTDWSARNVVLVDGRCRMAFDWDSLARTPEGVAVGQAALTWRSTGEPDGPAFPDPAGVAAYVADYEGSSSQPLGAAGWAAAGAAALATLAYTARCELAVAHRWPGADHAGHAGSALRRHGDAYLHLAPPPPPDR